MNCNVPQGLKETPPTGEVVNLGIWLNTHNDREAHDKLTDVDGCGNIPVELEGHLGAPLRKIACARSTFRHL